MSSIKSFFLIAIWIISAHNINCQKNQTPNHIETWDNIETHILQEWHLSVIDSSKILWLGDKGIIPPKPYMTISDEHKLIYYWDSYFTNKGLLLVDSLRHFAQYATENLLWMVDTLGFVPNSNMFWGMSRSQPPFLAMMVHDVYKKTKVKTWLKKAYKTLKKEYHFWTDTSSTAIENHSTAIPGLQRFYHHASEQELIAMYKECFQRGLLKVHPDSIVLEKKLELASQFVAEAATGMDFNPRFEGRCADYIPVELNSNLYQYEVLLAGMVRELGLKNEPNWKRLAQNRKKLINKYLWNDKRGMYMDYDFKNNRLSPVASIVSYYPLLAGIANKKQAKRAVKNLSLFEFEYGVAVCENSHQPIRYQWDYPAGWPPMYLQTIEALDKYGYKKEALRIATKYLNIAARNFTAPAPINYTTKKGITITREPGKIYEKYNVVTGGINDLEYPAREFLGWSAGVYLWCLDYYKKTKTVGSSDS